jgi:hypothetical protein
MSLSDQEKSTLRQFARQRQPYTIPNSAYETALSQGLSADELREWEMPEERIIEIVGPPSIPGCTNPEALNFNTNATVDDGSCEFNPNRPPILPLPEETPTLQEMVAHVVDGKMDPAEAQRKLDVSEDNWGEIFKHYTENRIPEWEGIPTLPAKKTDLWVMGIPGSGKSAMLSAVIGRLNSEGKLMGSSFATSHVAGFQYRKYLINSYDLNMCPEPTQIEGFNFVPMDLIVDLSRRRFQPVNLIEMAGDKVRDLISKRDHDAESSLVNLDWLDSRNPKVITIVLDVKNNELSQAQDLTMAFELLRERKVLKRTQKVMLLVTKVDLFDSFTPESNPGLLAEVLNEVTKKFSTLVNTIKAAGIQKIDVVPFSVGENFVQDKYIRGGRHHVFVDEYIAKLCESVDVRKLPRN